MSERSGGNENGPRRLPNGLLDKFEQRRDSTSSIGSRSSDHEREPDYTDNKSKRRSYVRPDELKRLINASSDADYYSLLGLSRDPPPTEERIRSAFHSLSLSFHPDKQPPVFRRLAKGHYSKIQEAYETLVDPQKRVVYDLLGKDGVKAEWGVGGAMGRGGEAQKQQVGVRAMTSAEFRRWFLAMMKGRERRALEDMVGSLSSVTVGVNAVPFFQRWSLVEDEDQDAKNKPFLRASSFHLKHSFKAPLAWLKSIWSTDSPRSTNQVRTEPTSGSEVDNGPELVIGASLGGKIRRYKRQITVKFPDTGEEETREILLPPTIITKQFGLESKLYYAIPELAEDQKPSLRSPFTLLHGSTLELGGLLLPSPVLQASLGRAFRPVAGARPLEARVQATFHDYISHMPPQFDITIARVLGRGQSFYWAWNTGKTFWPPSVIKLFQPLVSLAIPDGVYDLSPGGFTIGYNSRFSKPDLASGEYDEHQDQQQDASAEPKPFSRQAWGVQIGASPSGSSISINYSRDLFGNVMDAPARSQWSSEGKRGLHDVKAAPVFEPVKLELAGTLDLDASLGWSIGASRKVGELTRMGFAVGVQGVRGLALIVTWSRLGQTLRVPIVLCPSNLLNQNMLEVAVVAPWAAFYLVEFGYLRPRARRKWQADIERRRSELKALVAKRKGESEEAVSLMTDQVKRRQQREASEGGLVIVRAQYGAPDTKSSKKVGNMENPEMIDVTIPVAALVAEGQLFIARQARRSDIIGFYDPAPLSPKILRVRYLFRGEEHLVEVREGEDLVCPMKRHKLSSVHDVD